MAEIKVINNQIILENKYAEIVLSKEALSVIDIIDKSNGCSIMGESTEFFLFKDKENKKIDIKGADLDKDILSVHTNAEKVEIKVFCGDYFSFELINGLPEGVECAILAEAKYSYDYSDKKNTGANGIAMTCSVNPNCYPDAKSLATGGSVFRSLESLNAKYAIVIAPICEMQALIKGICNDINPSLGLVSRAGGAWGIDYEQNYASYSIQTEISPEWMKNSYPILKKHTSTDEYRFHQGPDSFRQGDFKYYYFKDNADFKAQVSDVIERDGGFTGLHTYSFYIAYDCDTILSKPENLKQLCVLKSYTLKSDITIDADFIPTEESTAEISPSLESRQTPFILIDNELIRFQKADGGFKIAQRGCAGTKAAEHKKASQIKHIHGHYGCIAPKIGSKLFYDIAESIATAANEGGYQSIYFDALDGIRFHEGNTWYWCAKFLCEVLKHLKSTMLFEYSWIMPSIWAARGRYGAYDVSAKAYKEMNKRHAAANRVFLDRFGTATLGWYAFYPQDLSAPADTNERYQHTDDIDYLGAIAVSHDYGNVFHLKAGYFAENAGFRRNVALYKKYDELRKAHYFSEETLEKIRTGKWEYQLREKRGSKYSFVEKAYQSKRLYDINAPEYKTTEWENPFGKQAPFLRIEPLLSTQGLKPLTLLKLSESKNLTSQNLKTTFPQPLDLSTRVAKKVRIKGNGKKGAICIRIYGNGFIEHFIDTNFEGWKEFVLIEADNGTRNDLKFDTDEIVGHFHAVTRVGFRYSRVNSIEVLTDGDVKGVRMSSIIACAQTYDVFKNPSVTVGDTNVIFSCEIASGEYIEFDGKEAVVFDRFANKKSIYFSTLSKMLLVPKGKFTAEFNAKSLNDLDAPRAFITFGFTGKEIK